MASGTKKIEKSWVKDESRTFTGFPGVPGTNYVGPRETWLELAQFYVEDLRWLLSLEHHKFWSHMIYSGKAHELIVNFLKEFPSNHLKSSLLIHEDIKNVFKEMEHLVFLLFLRLSTEKESATCHVKNFGEILYNNQIFTIPIILDICSIYGTSNGDLVKKMISDVIAVAPYFLDDFQEVIPSFLQSLKTVREKFSGLSSKPSTEEGSAEDTVLFLSDLVATIERFIELYPSICTLFSTGELISELVCFYSNVLPEIEILCLCDNHLVNENSWLYDLIRNARIDIMKIVKSVFDFVLNERNEFMGETEVANEYLILMTELISEPVFFCDYNLLYSVEFEVQSAVRNCHDVDKVKLNHVLTGVASLLSSNGNDQQENMEFDVEMKSLVMDVKGIFPHLEEDVIEKCLRYYEKNVERAISAFLENSVPVDVGCNDKKGDYVDPVREFRGKHKNRYGDLTEMLDDREEINAIKGRCTELSFVADDMYDDEYDDTYDESSEFLVKEGDEIDHKEFVVPRVLRQLNAEEDGEGEEEEYEREDEDEERHGRDCFVENPAVLRQRLEQKRADRGRRDFRGRGRGQGQSKEVLRNRGFKESHKSLIGNHNRKKQASKKLSRGMIFP